jgi:hypothetical protein
MNHLMDILGELSADPVARDAYLRDPQAFAGSAGLAPEARSALAQRDWNALEHMLACGSWARAAFYIDPGPDPLPDDVSDQDIAA